MLLTLATLSLSFALHASPRASVVDHAAFAQWPASKQRTYVRDVRRAFGQFERPTPMRWTESVDDGQLCVVGGVLRARVATGDGGSFCPTTGNPCEPIGDEGFTCGMVYDAACVSRTPVATLTKRCEAESDRTEITRAGFESLRASVADVDAACEARTFARVHAENCGLFTARMTYLNAKFGGASNRRAAEAAAETVSSLVDVPRAAPAERAPLCRGTPYRIVNDGGGNVDTFVARAKTLAQSGRKLEIKGFCASACLLYLAKVPKERICIGPNASLGFHQAMDQYGRVDYAYTAWAVKTYYSPELKALWANHYSDSTQINVAHYRELTRYYATCDGAGDKCSASAQASAEAVGTPLDGHDDQSGTAY